MVIMFIYMDKKNPKKNIHAPRLESLVLLFILSAHFHTSDVHNFTPNTKTLNGKQPMISR